jgi:hypothetical protein
VSTHIGYTLINLADSSEVQSWTATMDGVVLSPPRIVLPDGSAVEGATAGWEGNGYRLVKSYLDDAKPGPLYSPTSETRVFNGTDFIVTNVYPSQPNITAPVPSSVSPLQARRALRQVGLIDQVNTMVASADPDAKDAWEYSNQVERTNPIVLALAAQLNLNDATLDNLFRLASTL